MISCVQVIFFLSRQRLTSLPVFLFFWFVVHCFGERRECPKYLHIWFGIERDNVESVLDLFDLTPIDVLNFVYIFEVLTVMLLLRMVSTSCALEHVLYLLCLVFKQLDFLYPYYGFLLWYLGWKSTIWGFKYPAPHLRYWFGVGESMFTLFMAMASGWACLIAWKLKLDVSKTRNGL